MTGKELGSILGRFLVTVAIVLVFSGFGDAHGSLYTALHNVSRLITDTVTGVNLRAQYWTLTPAQIYFTIRLVIVAFVFSVALGIMLTVARARIRNRVMRTAVNAITPIFESMPETMYVIILVLLVLFALQYNIVLPVFSAVDPTWSTTAIPAFALSLPGAFYLQKVLSLHIDDEIGSGYILTAKSKGLSDRRAFYVHLVPNLRLTLFASIPVLAALILSSSIFTEYFMEYTGALFNFTNFAIGWNYNNGIPLTAVKPTGIPEFQTGLVFMIGLLLCVIWLVFRLFSYFLGRSITKDGFTTLSASQRWKMRWPSFSIGTCMLLCIVAIGAIYYMMPSSAPLPITSKEISENALRAYPPSVNHPFGTDLLDRGLLAEAARGTFATLRTALEITLLTLLSSLAVAIIAFSNRSGRLPRLVRLIGESLSGIPVLFILFLALYTRNIQTHHQALQFIIWVTIAEMGRGAYASLASMERWHSFTFIEGVTSVGRTRVGALFSHLRSWLTAYTAEYGFTEFARVLTIMTQLAAFHIYTSEKMGYLPYNVPGQGIVATQQTWVSMIGDATSGMAYMFYPWILYAPVAFLLFTVIGANLVARGIRG